MAAEIEFLEAYIQIQEKKESEKQVHGARSCYSTRGEKKFKRNQGRKKKRLSGYFSGRAFLLFCLNGFKVYYRVTSLGEAIEQIDKYIFNEALQP